MYLSATEPAIERSKPRSSQPEAVYAHGFTQPFETSWSLLRVHQPQQPIFAQENGLQTALSNTPSYAT